LEKASDLPQYILAHGLTHRVVQKFLNAKIEKEQWLIHITNHADEIIKDGFKIDD
jgi:hypothetical protein